MQNILWITGCAAYDGVTHAGGQTVNYFIKNLAQNGRYFIKNITFASDFEIEKLISNGKKYSYDVIPVIKDTGIKEFLLKILSINSKFNPFCKMAGLVTWKRKIALIKK